MKHMQEIQEISWLLKEKYRGEKTPQVLKDVERIKKGEPVDYVIGFVEFLGSTIDLSQKPLIPRPETEYWVERAIGELRYKSKIHCLDIFAGSGCIGIAILKHVPQAHVDFAEKEKKFLQQIRRNLALNRIPSHRYRLVRSDLFSHAKGRYDFIFANPPYLATTRRRFIQQSVLDWEPHAALFAGPDGLLYIRKFLHQAKKHLNPGGTIYLEFDSFQKPSIARILRSSHFRRFEFSKDQYGKWRYVIVYEK